MLTQYMSNAAATRRMAMRKRNTPLQSVFRLELKSHQDALRANPRAFVPRKAHKKSRSGCRACKQKRVKCDEAKPTCCRCVRLEIDCYYESSARSTDVLLDTLTTHTPTSDLYSMSIDLLETNLDSLMSIETAGLPAFDAELSNVRILQHFQSVVSLTLGCSMVQKVMHLFVAKTAWSHPYLMHMILALSCAHQKRFLPLEWSRKQSALAEAANWQSGLQQYRHHLRKLELGLHGGDWDAEVATTFLQIMFTFALEDDIPLNSLDSTEEAFGHAIEPFNAIGNFRSLFRVSDGFDPNSLWGRVLLSTDDAKGTFTSEEPGIQGLPRAFVDLCELGETSSSDNNPYHKILRALTPLFHLQRSQDNFSILFAFLGRTWRYFKPLVLSKDARGLLLISYWLALLKQVDQWWLTTRARAECMAVTAHLSTLLDPAINSLLPFPAAFGSSDESSMWELLEQVLQDIK